MTETQYQTYLIKVIENELLPGSLVLKNNANFIQGIPDLVVLYFHRWALLEVKVSATAPEQPNQRYYIERFAPHTFSAFIYPENEEEVLRALQRSLAL